MITATIVSLVVSLVAMSAALALNIYQRKSEPCRAAQAVGYVVEAEDSDYLVLLELLIKLRKLDLKYGVTEIDYRLD